jgi:hypothetical protein
MVITMITVGMVQMAAHQVVDVVAVWNGFMTAARPMHVTRIVPAAPVFRRAAIGIRRRYLNEMFVNVAVVRVMQVSVVQIVDVVAVLYCGMSAIGPVYVRMIGVMWFVAGCH